MRLLVAVLGALALVASPAMAGVIRGSLFLSPAALRSNPADSANDPARPQRGVTDAVIYVERIPDRVERKLSGHGWFFTRRLPAPRVVQSHLAFVPRVTAVTAGGLVEFQNLDRVYHNAFSVSAARRFDLGKYPPGRMDSITFGRVGVVNLHCGIHSEMNAYISSCTAGSSGGPSTSDTISMTEMESPSGFP